MLKINDLLIKLIIDLYLVIICFSYISVYVCAYVHPESWRTWLGICIFVFYLLFRIDNDFVIMLIYCNNVK